MSGDILPAGKCAEVPGHLTNHISRTAADYQYWASTEATTSSQCSLAAHQPVASQFPFRRVENGVTTANARNKRPKDQLLALQFCSNPGALVLPNSRSIPSVAPHSLRPH